MQFIYIYIYSTIFMSTLHVSNDRAVHHQQLIVVHCITQLCTLLLTADDERLDPSKRVEWA